MNEESTLALPVETYGQERRFLAAGFRFGEPYPNDPMFRPAVLPPGWTKSASVTPEWSLIRDETGRWRVWVYYRPTEWNRQASMAMREPS